MAVKITLGHKFKETELNFKNLSRLLKNKRGGVASGRKYRGNKVTKSTVIPTIGPQIPESQALNQQLDNTQAPDDVPGDETSNEPTISTDAIDLADVLGRFIHKRRIGPILKRQKKISTNLIKIKLNIDQCSADFDFDHLKSFFEPDAVVHLLSLFN